MGGEGIVLNIKGQRIWWMGYVLLGGQQRALYMVMKWKSGTGRKMAGRSKEGHEKNGV